MKKRTKKVQAKMDLLKLAEQHAFLAEREKLGKLLTAINDKDLDRLVANFVLAKVELELYLGTLKTDVAPFLTDDSEF